MVFFSRESAADYNYRARPEVFNARPHTSSRQAPSFADKAGHLAGACKTDPLTLSCNVLLCLCEAIFRHLVLLDMRPERCGFVFCLQDISERDFLFWQMFKKSESFIF